jgi:hypothetical protein
MDRNRRRAAGVPFEDRQSLLGHKAAHLTTHYSAADIGNLVSYAEKACDLVSRKSPALSIVRSARASQVIENVGGKGGNRTLDPGIMSALPWLPRLNRDPIVDPKSLITLNF